MKTLQDLIDDRARGLDAIDDILRSAAERPEAERSLTADERADHDYLAACCDELSGEIARANEANENDLIRANQEIRRSWTPPVVNVNTLGGSGAPATASRSLDELLWATDEVVRACSFDRVGDFQPHPTAVNSVEQVIARSQNGEETLAPRITELPPQHRDVVRSFQKTVADMAIFGMLVDEQAKNSRNGFEVARSHPAFASRWQNICRAMDVDTSGEGGTWVPTGIGANLHEKVRAAGKLATLFARIDIPTNPWKWPIEGSDATAYRVAEPTSDTESKPTASTPGTVAATFDAEIFGARSLVSRSLEPDSALAILPFVQRKLIRAFVDGEEKAILDGDTDGTHQDSDVGSSTTDVRTAWDGLRKRALAETTQATTATTAANLLAIRKSMGKWGINPADLVYIVGVQGYLALLGDSNFLTVDKMGPNATILNGMIGSVYGSPVIASEHVRETLNASGVYDGITTTKTYSLCVNRNEWAFGQRMALDVKIDDSIYAETFQRVMISFMREDFQSIASASTDDNTSIGYNVTSGS